MQAWVYRHFVHVSLFAAAGRRVQWFGQPGAVGIEQRATGSEGRIRWRGTCRRQNQLSARFYVAGFVMRQLIRTSN